MTSLFAWCYLETRRNAIVMMTSHWILQISFEWESPGALTITTPTDSSQWKSNNVFHCGITKSHLRLFLGRIKCIRIWFNVVFVTLLIICDATWTGCAIRKLISIYYTFCLYSFLFTTHNFLNLRSKISMLILSLNLWEPVYLSRYMYEAHC